MVIEVVIEMLGPGQALRPTPEPVTSTAFLLCRLLPGIGESSGGTPEQYHVLSMEA